MFSILIANYNNGQYLETAIKSILTQTCKDYEIVIVDDCSTDNSKLIYEKHRNDSRFTIEIFPENKGCGAAKRRCIELAKGEHCAFLDADDALVPNAIEYMNKIHLENPSASLVSSCYYKCDKNLKVMHLRKLKPHCEDFLYAKDVDLHFASFKRNLYLKTLGINENFKRAVDQDLYLKLNEVGNFVYISKYLYYYRMHDGGISTITNDNSDKAFQWFVLAKYNACKRRNIDFDRINIPHPNMSIPLLQRILKYRNFLKSLYMKFHAILHIYSKYDLKL